MNIMSLLLIGNIFLAVIQIIVLILLIAFMPQRKRKPRKRVNNALKKIKDQINGEDE